MSLRALLVGALLLTMPVAAQDDRQAAIVTAFEAWMSDHGITKASIAVLAGDARAPTLTKGYGRDAAAPVTLASLSKAITGACIAVFQQEGVFDLDAQISTLIDAPEGAGSLHDFLSQTSGFDEDLTQGKPWHLEADRTPRHKLATKLALDAPRADASFRYNNANYAVLGAVIDAHAQQDYEADCRSLVLDPLGIATAALDPVWAPLGAWGGWSMSVGDYARFAKEWFGSPRNIGRAPLDWPHAELGRGAKYVMGSFYRNLKGRNVFWHAGLLCWGDEGDGSYFASYGGEMVVVVSYAACLEDGALGDLDTVLFKAALR
ncbi:beta-lactamase [Litoreibacter meonggei]|uniref:Beta-lactamase n=1 Tax=Litoreibacter meonggei TaxID=1049199 RepID=A0A497VF25_9RHOB|nr:serine hydrolase [Litoreibacter meonggei]RLJ40817.1 beta-lactamase [Litoreibacter meonggei]